MNQALSSSLAVIPLSAHIGAEIRGVDLTGSLSAAEIAGIREALLKWRVIFFREQFLNHQQHVAFSAQFGEPTVGHPVFGSWKAIRKSIRSPSSARPRATKARRCDAPGPAGTPT